MSRFVQPLFEEGGSVLVEDEDPRRPFTRGGASDEWVTKTGTLEYFLGRWAPTCGIDSELRTTDGWPKEVEAEFAVKLSTDANVIISRAGGNIRIALRWVGERT